VFGIRPIIVREIVKFVKRKFGLNPVPTKKVLIQPDPDLQKKILVAGIILFFTAMQKQAILPSINCFG
jgi:hypothetical protein